jgi:beta-phosphoglucomutase-like phosphatase (HAD superfamily)
MWRPDKLGLPDQVRACLFDLDGVLTDTASVHRKAWKQMFDDYLRQHAERTGEPFRPFDIDADYLTYVDGKKREDGVTGAPRTVAVQPRKPILPPPEQPPGREPIRRRRRP